MEVLVGMLILTIVITTSLAVFVERGRRLRQASEMILAYQVLANEAEFWRREPYDDLATTNEFRSPKDLLDPLKPYGTAVMVADDENEDGVRRVTLTIRWQTGKREARLELVRVDTDETKVGEDTLW